MGQLELELIEPILISLEQPVFATKNGVVFFGNSAFHQMQIAMGTPLHEFFGVERQYPEGTIDHAECVIAGIHYAATILPLKNGALYLLRPFTSDISTQFLAHTAQSMRLSLHSMYSALSCLCRRMEDHEDEKLQAYSAAVLQGLYQLERTADNMELLQKLRCGEYNLKLQKTDIPAYFSELLSKAQDLLRYADVHLESRIPEKRFNGNIDERLTETVFWNLLSNAGANANGGTISVELKHSGKQLHITVTDSGIGLSTQSLPQLFERYAVSMDQSAEQKGAGIGLSLIREAAQLMGGSMILGITPDGRTSTTVTFHLDGEVIQTVRTPMFVGGGLDRGLVGLSPILPREAFDTRDIL